MITRIPLPIPHAAAALAALTTLGMSALPVFAQSTVTVHPVTFPSSTAATTPTDNLGNVTDAMRKEDPRLLQRVTIREPRVYVGELLEMLQAKTGVPLSASDKDGAAGEQVAVFLNDIPLADVMESLWSLLSYRKAERIWQREGTGSTNYQYQFLRPASVDALANKLKQDIQKDFESEANKFTKAIKLSPEELKAAADRDPSIKNMTATEGDRAGLRTLSEALSTEQRQSLLGGKTTFNIPVSQLPSSGKTFVAVIREQLQKSNPNMVVPEPISIYFHRTTMAANITPSLFMEVNPFGGFAYVGGTLMENKWRGNVTDQWLLPGDTPVNATKEAASVPPPAPGKTVPYDDMEVRDKRGRPIEVRGKLGKRLAQMNYAVPSLSLLARWPVRRISSGEYDVESPYKRTLADILSRFVDFGQPHKWRHDVLLLGNNNWFNTANAEDEAVQNVRIPWSLIKRLRAEEVSNGGFLSADTLLWAAANLTKAERERLAFEEFPALKRVDAQGKGIQKLATYLGGARADYRTQIRSPRGLSIQRLPEDVAASMQSMAKFLGATEPVTAVRLQEEETTDKLPTVLEPEAPARIVKFIFLGRSGEPLGPRIFMEMEYPGRTLPGMEIKQASGIQ